MAGAKDSAMASAVPEAVLKDKPTLSIEEKLDQLMELQREFQKQLPAIDAKLDRVMNRLEATQTMTKEPTEETTVKEVLFRSGRSIAHLEAATNFQLVPVPSSNALYCKACVPHFSTALHVHEGVKVMGVYKYDFSLGSSFENDQILPPMLKNLKVAIQNHFESDKHAQNVKKREETSQLTQGRFVKNKTIAARVTRTGYYVMKKSLAHASFEDLIYMQVKNGLPMGDLNHSTAFMRTLRSQVHGVLRDKLARYVAAKPCVSLIVDKVTLWKRSLDLTAIVLTVPEAPVGHIVQSFVISAPIVTDASGEGLANEIVQSLASIGITDPDQLASICTDGQYLMCKVPSKVVQMLAEADQSARKKQPCVPAMWDDAHLLNLVDGDARKKQDCRWVDTTVSQMTAITKRHTHGKGFEALMERGAERGEQLLHPKLWSSTRFAPHASRTMAAFLRNAEAMADLLTERVRDGTADADSMMHQRLLKGSDFLNKVSALHDIYDAVASASAKLQDLQAFPWERKETFTKLVEVLDDMSDDLDEDTGVSSDSKAWTFLAKRPNSSEQVADIKALISRLIERIEERSRVAGARGRSVETANAAVIDNAHAMQRVADLTMLRSHTQDDCVLYIKTAIDDLVRAGLIPARAVPSRASIHAAWVFVRELTEGMSNAEMCRRLFLKSETSVAIAPYANLVSRIWLLSSPESVVESMASVTKDIFGEHRQLSHQNAATELFIRWNGPAVGSADGLLDLVQSRHDNTFLRSCQRSIQSSLQGTVVQRLQNQKCHRAPVYK